MLMMNCSAGVPGSRITPQIPCPPPPANSHHRVSYNISAVQAGPCGARDKRRNVKGNFKACESARDLCLVTFSRRSGNVRKTA